MTMRTAAILLAVCAGLAAPAVLAQDSASVQCPPPGVLTQGSGTIWAFG
jgi:hypothetical protein